MKAPGAVRGVLGHNGDLANGIPAKLVILSGTEVLKFEMKPKCPKLKNKGYNGKAPLVAGAWDDKGSLLTIADSDGMVRLFKEDTMTQLRGFNAIRDAKSATITNVQISTSIGRFIIVALAVKGQGVLQIYSFDSDEVVVRGFPIHKDAITGMYIQPSTTGNKDSEIILLTTKDGNVLLVKMTMEEEEDGLVPRMKLMKSFVPEIQTTEEDGISATADNDGSNTKSVPAQCGAWFSDGIRFSIARGNVVYVYRIGSDLRTDSTGEGDHNEGEEEKISIELVFSTIPHTKIINDMSLSDNGAFMVTCAGDEVKMTNTNNFRDLSITPSSHQDLPNLGDYLWHKSLSGKKYLGSAPEVSFISCISTDFIAFAGIGGFKSKRLNVYDVLQCRAGTLRDLPMTESLTMALECNTFWKDEFADSMSRSSMGANEINIHKKARFRPVYRLLNDAQHKRALETVLDKPEDAPDIMESLIERGSLSQALDCRHSDQTGYDEDRFINLLLRLARDFDRHPEWTSIYLESLRVLFEANIPLLRNTTNTEIIRACNKTLATITGTQNSLQYIHRII